MCDQTEVTYLPNDIVWVKLGNVWWPAQVQDETKLSEDVTSGLRKKPLAVVKFFDEDLYEFPKNINQIYHYNCFKKDEFIKKGLDLCRPSGYREVPRNMVKFPVDVKKAENLTGGNPNIIYDPKYLPEEKFDYREQFGLKPRKKSSIGNKKVDNFDETPKHLRVKFSSPISAPSTSRTPDRKISLVTKSFSNPIKRSRELKKLATLANSEFIADGNESHEYLPNVFRCSYCKFRCSRVGVVIEHYRGHYSGRIYPSPTHIPHNYYKIFQENFIKLKNGANNTPISIPKSGSEKIFLKRKTNDDFTPLKKRKYDSLKKDKTPSAPTPSGSSLAVPIKDIVGSASTPKKRPRKSKEVKTHTSKGPEALDILKDWEEDLEDEAETDMELSNSEQKEGDSSSNTKTDSNNYLNEDIPVPPVQDIKSPVFKEKCCFDFEDNDESLNLNKSLKFGQKLPRVISEEKPDVKRLLKELKESKGSSSKEESVKEDFSQDFESLLKSTEVPKLPDIPYQSLTAKTNEKTFNEVFNSFEKQEIEASLSEEKKCKDITKKVTDFESNKITESSEQKIVKVAGSVEETIVQVHRSDVNEKSTDFFLAEVNNASSAKNVDKMENDSNDLIAKSSSHNLVSSDDTSVDQKKNENIHLQQMIGDDVLNDNELSSDIQTCGKNISTASSLVLTQIQDNVEHNIPLATEDSTLIEPDHDNSDEKKRLLLTSEEEDVLGMAMNVEDSINDKFVEEKCTEETLKDEGYKKNKTNVDEKVIGMDKEVKNFEESAVENELDSSVVCEKLCIGSPKGNKEEENTELSTESNPNSSNGEVNVKVVNRQDGQSETVKLHENNPSTNFESSPDQIPFDINSMPIVIDQDPIMEIVEGHVEPLPNADVVRLYIRNRGEEEPEDFQSPRRLLTVSPPPPNMPPLPGMKKIALPPPKNKTINHSSTSAGNIGASSASGSSMRFTLSKPPNKVLNQTLQQPKILFLKSTTNAPNKLLIPQQQGSLIAPSGKLQPGTRILTTNAQLVSKVSPQKKVGSKPIIIGKQGFPTTAKVVQKPVGHMLQKVTSQTLIGNKSTSTVLINAPKTVVTRPVGKNMLLTTPQFKNQTGIQISQAGTKVTTLRPAQVVKNPEKVISPKPGVQVLTEAKKQVLKNKQTSPNILQRTHRKPGRQQVVKKSQLLTIPGSVQQQSAEVVTVNNLPVVQSIGSQSSAEPVKMLYLVDNNQYTVENPVDNDNNSIFVTSTASSGNIDNIIFSIDGTGNLLNISEQTSGSTPVPSQDILAKALANTQVLQSDTTELDNTAYVEQQYPAPSLSNTVLETSLTLNQAPIMTPLEVPSSVPPQSSLPQILPLTNITQKSDIQQPSMPLLTDEVEVPTQTVFLSDSGNPNTSGHMTFQLVHDNNVVVSSGLVQGRSSKPATKKESKAEITENKEENVLPEFLKGNFGSNGKNENTPKVGER